MSTQPIRCVTISTFNLGNFNALLRNDESLPSIEVIPTEFGQVQALLLDPAAPSWEERPDCAFIWTEPQVVAPSFARLCDLETVDLRTILEEVEEFAGQVLVSADQVETVFIPTWTAARSAPGLRLLDFRKGTGVANTLMYMNLTLAEALETKQNVFLLDAQRWIQSGGDMAHNPKLWYMAKIPFTNPVFRAGVVALKAALTSLTHPARKLVVLDLDDTLWGGVVGDDGWKNLRLGGHDPVGEAFVDFQRGLRALANRGILLGIVSKNTEAVALEGIQRHPEMVLRADDFAGWRINWRDKAKNLVDLAEELNLGLQSIVFIDDSEHERARVREALPEVFVPEWTPDPIFYRKSLLELSCFDTPSISSEDRQRGQMYRAERKRRSAGSDVTSVDEWLKSLSLTVTVERLDEANVERVVQLLNKTNQMNLRTRRMTADALKKWLRVDSRSLKAFRVSDRFGDSGLTGLLTLELQGDTAYVSDFVLSCRVMGRRVEETMAAVAVEWSRTVGASRVVVEYLPTPKNEPCLDFWRKSGFSVEEPDRRFAWEAAAPYPTPDHVTLQNLDA